MSVGRFAREKGPRYLIEALNLLKQQKCCPGDARFSAKVNLKQNSRALVAEYGLSEQVAFPGFCENVFSVLLTADVFVLPSLHESSPNALIEAMGIGMPCIASDLAGIAHLLEDEVNGLRVPAKNAEALASALHQVLTAPDFAAELGKNARATIQQKFNSVASMQKLERNLSAIILIRTYAPTAV